MCEGFHPATTSAVVHKHSIVEEVASLNRRHARAFWRRFAAVLLLLVPACGDSQDSMTTSPTTPPDQAAITVAIAPANSTPLGDPVFPWAASFTVTLFETAGIAFDVEAIIVQLEEPVIFPNSVIEAAAGSSRVPGLGRLVIPLSIGLTENGLTAQVVVRGTDDNGNALEALGRLVVIPAQGP